MVTKSQSATVKLPMGNVTLTPGVLDELSEKAYMQGQCHALAYALSRRLRRSPMLLLNVYDEFEDTEHLFDDDHVFTTSEIAEYWLHAFVPFGEGTYLDIRGLHSFDDFVATYDSGCDDSSDFFRMIKVPRNTLLSLYKYEHGGKRPRVAVATTFVAPLLARYAPKTTNATATLV
jgi:hypothetical protein